MYILKSLTYITFLTEILPLVFCVIFFKKINTKGLKVFFIYTILLSFFSITGLALLFFNSKSAYILIVRLYTIVEYILLSILLYNFFENKTAKRVVIFSIFPFVIFTIINLLINEYKYSSYPLLIEFFCFIIFIIYFFYEKMNSSLDRPIYQNISFWICVGLFFYFTGNFFFLLFPVSSTDLVFKNQIQSIYIAVTITKNIILSLSFFATEFKEDDDTPNFPSNLNLDGFRPYNNLN